MSHRRTLQSRIVTAEQIVAPEVTRLETKIATPIFADQAAAEAFVGLLVGDYYSILGEDEVRVKLVQT